tara:strand:+ start:9028 stop:9303 length:276 start_codon:yes stop_codon:yes gene_type:complete
MAKEIFILNTTELYSSSGVVHIQSIGFDPEDSAYIEFDAKALLEDIPALYKIAKQAIKQKEVNETNKYVEFRKEIANDYKGKRGRKSLISN